MPTFEEFQNMLMAKDFYKFSHDVYTYMMLRVKLIQNQPDNMLTQDPLIQQCIEPIVKAVFVLSLVSRNDGPDAFLAEYVDFNDDDFMLFVIDIINDAFVDDVHAYALYILSTIFALIKKCSNRTQLDLFHVGAMCFTEMLSLKEETFLAERGWEGLLIAATPYEKAYDDFLGAFISKEIDWIKLTKFIHLKAKDRTEREDMFDVVEGIVEGEPVDVDFFYTILPALKGYVEYHEKEDSEDKNLSAEKIHYVEESFADSAGKYQGEEMEFLTQKVQNLTSSEEEVTFHVLQTLNVQTD